jgi:ABC-2 type transport system permease protein
MNKITLIARHEFLVTIRRRAFIIFTLAFPLLAILGILATQVISGLVKPPAAAETVGYIDQAGGFTDYASQGNVNFKPFATPEDAHKALLDNGIEEYFVISPDYLQTGAIQRYTLNRQIDTSGKTEQVIRNFLLGNLLKGNSQAVIDRVKAPLNMTSIILTTSGEVAPNQGGFAAFIIPYIFGLLLLMSIFFSSGYLLQGLGEEKENRVMEILLSSVSARQLLAGKVIGLGAAGLLQVIIWLFSAQFLARYASSTWGAIIGNLQVPAEFLILGTVYFILGYLLFAVLMAGVGAISPTAREGQQLSTLFTVTGVIPLMFMQFIIENPNHVVSQALTIIPITAPITVMIRLGITEIPVWQIAASVAVMVLAIVGCFILAAKLFRTFLLMYGKRPDFSEILRSFRKA